MNGPVLRTATCTVRSPVVADAASIVRHANSRAIWVNLRDRFPYPYTLDDARTWIEGARSQNPPVSLSIDVDGAVVGGISLRVGADIERCTAELGYWLGEEYWGRGIATCAVQAMTAYGFESLGLARIFATPMAWNPASCRVLEKAGYEKEGVMRNACVKDGKIVDMILYAAVPDSIWPAIKPP